ncbi:MAG: RedB protein, partial [Myxococcales bacterium]|nr:RedB protein [Myxococcales bacterium]
MLLAVLWLSLVGVGAAHCYRFETSAGTAAPAPVTWPLETMLTRSQASPTLVMFAHPECACTAASLAELADLLAESAVTVRPRVMVVFTGGQDPRASANWQRAGTIIGALRLRDDSGDARRFGARTSG